MLRGKWTTELLPVVEKYGPVVRIRPGELLFTDPDAWRDIYSHHNGAVVKGEEFAKSDIFYQTPGVVPSLLAESRDNHTLIRRQFNYGFSDKILRDQESIVKGYVDLLMQRLRERCIPSTKTDGGEKETLSASKTAFDLRRWYNYTTFDIIGDMAFGEPFGSLEAGTESQLVKNIESGLARQPLGTAFKLMGLGWMISRLAGRNSKFRRDSARRTAEKLRRRMGLNVERPDLIGSLLRKQEDWNIPFERLRANAGLLVVAGSETTATLLCGVTYLLLRNPECLRKVTEEVRSAFESEHDITFSSVQNLPYSKFDPTCLLHLATLLSPHIAVPLMTHLSMPYSRIILAVLACLREALRCYPPVAGPLPRVVPKGGANITGHFVPEGTTVVVAQWPMNHSTRNFSDPFSFRPERFLTPEKFPYDKLDAVQPFSTGPRDCIGKK
jgi:cytochrome P450